MNDGGELARHLNVKRGSELPQFSKDKQVTIVFQASMPEDNKGDRSRKRFLNGT